jgi:preprotein translocase subunit SecY
MLKAFMNIWRIPDLRNKIFFTLGMLVIYRIGFKIPLPGVSQEALAERLGQAGQEGSTGLGDAATLLTMFTGGSFSQSTIFGLGIMPYISAAIILQLLTSVLEPLKKLQKEGPSGRQKILEYTRYLTVALALFQSSVWLGVMEGQGIVLPEYSGSFIFWFSGLVGLTAGTTFLMWLGEQIDKYGIGNGASLIITAGIITGMPTAIGIIAGNFDLTGLKSGSYGPMTVIFLAVAFVTVVAGAVVITQAQRRIPVQQAKHTRGRKVFGGQRSYLPLRVNHGGVMPIIFASSLLILPAAVLGGVRQAIPSDMTWAIGVVNFLDDNLRMGAYLHILLYVGMIYFFAYFWTTVQFQPSELATQLRDHGSFIPGLRPGPRTAEYLETVMERITYVGGGCLAIIAIVPEVLAGVGLFGPPLPFMVTAFLGGTGLLITVSVVLDLIQRIEASLLMRNYEGFMGAATGSRGGRIRGRSST